MVFAFQMNECRLLGSMLLKFGYDERRLDKSQKFRDMAACIPSGLGADRMTSLVLVDQ